MVKSERGKAISSYSNSSFINLQKNKTVVAQSASFREVTGMKDLIKSARLDNPNYILATAAN